MSRQRKIVGDSLTLAIRQTVGLALTVLQTLFAAKYLGPAGFGTFAIISVLAMIASVGNLGYLGAASRELPHYRATGDADSEKTAFNHTAIGELSIAAFWTLVILAAASAQDNHDLRIYLVLVALSVVPAKLLSLYQLRTYVDKEFEFQSRVSLLVTGVTAALVIALVWRLHLYAVLAAPVVASFAGIAVCRVRYRLGLRWQDCRREEFVRLARIGLPMAGLAITASNNGLQRWIERGLINSYLGSAALGAYAFFGWITLALYSMFGGLIQALQPHVLEIMSRELDAGEVRRYLITPIWTISTISLLVTGACMAVIPGIIYALLGEYAAGIPVMYVLLAATCCACFYWIPGIMLSAVRFNAQLYYLYAWLAAIAVSTVLALALLAAGWDSMALAVAYLVSQLMMAALSYRRVWNYLFPEPGTFRSLVKELFLPLSNVVAAVIVVVIIWDAALPAATTTGGHLLTAAIKALAFAILTVPTLVLLERRTSLYAAHIRPLLIRLTSARGSE